MSHKLLKNVIIGSAMSICLAAPSFAATTSAQRIVEVWQSANGKVTVKLDGAVTNPASCPQSVYVIDPSEGSRKDMLATLLTAKAMGTTVRLAINDTVCTNNNNNPKISTIILQ